MEARDAMISTKKKSKMESDGCDRITMLPEPIIHRIFSFLKTIDVIKASAVSRKWRYLWISCPYFNIDINTVWSDPWKFGDLATRVEKFKDFVNWVLIMSQNSPTFIDRFRLSSMTIRDDDCSVYRWIAVAARRNVKELDLSINPHAPFELSFSLVNCESLKVLKLDLQEKALKLPSFMGFRQLKSLELVNVKLTDEIITRNFITTCPVLEDLSFSACIFSDFKALEIYSNSLKHLTIDNQAFHDPCGAGLNKSELKMACSSLLSFKYRGYARDFSSQDLTSLENAFILIDDDAMGHVTEEEGAYVVCKLLGVLCNVEVLEVSASILALLRLVPSESYRIPFGNLKSLRLVLCHPFHVKPLINLLKFSPNLEVLKIYFDESDLTDWGVPDMAITCLTHHLKMVELVGAVGDDNELNLIKVLLKNGHVLEKMRILLWKDVDTEQIIQEIKELPTSSTTVALTFLYLKSDANIFDL